MYTIDLLYYFDSNSTHILSNYAKHSLVPASKTHFLSLVYIYFLKTPKNLWVYDCCLDKTSSLNMSTLALGNWDGIFFTTS